MAPDDNAPPHQDETAAAADGGSFGMRAPTFGEIAHELLDNGYEPIPIRPGSKLPAPRQWTSLRIDDHQVDRWARWFGKGGVGLRTGRLVGVDLDIEDPDLAHAAAQVVEARLGATLMRVGRWPRRLLVYRTDQPFAKLAVTGAEVLGAGQQFVAFGRHPAGRLYGWPLGDTPLDTPLEDLPPVDRDSCAQLLGELAQLLPQRSQNPRGSRNAAPGAPAGPARDAEGRVIDGRDGWLSTLAYHAVQDVLHSEGALDAERLAAAVWRRFEETADLGRPKQAAGAAYGFEDAARKVADKLRLLREGRLPPRETPAVDAPEVDGLPIDAARAELDRLIVAACARIADWRLGDAAGPAPQIGIRATVGLGKSTVARQQLVELREQLLNGGAPARILICAPSHALAEETARAWRDTGL